MLPRILLAFELAQNIRFLKKPSDRVEVGLFVLPDTGDNGIFRAVLDDPYNTPRMIPFCMSGARIGKLLLDQTYEGKFAIYMKWF